MINTVFGTKQDMAVAYSDAGKRQPVTRLVLPEQRLSKLLTPENEGYLAWQVAVGRKRKPANKPLAGQLKKANLDYQPQYLREVRLSEADDTLKVGLELDFKTILIPGSVVTVTATSKGKGFAGVVKRHHFAGGPKTHGQSDRHRAPGAIGQGTTPGRVFKGKRMAGRMGSETITVKNLKVLEFDSDSRLLTVSGPVPGARGALVKIKVTKPGVIKTTEATPEVETK